VDKEVKKKWLRALRSGAYVQGDSFLAYRNKSGKDNFCCLGVLCDIYANNHDGVYWEPSKIISTSFGDNSKKHKNVKPLMIFDEDLALPQKVMVWAGIYSSDGEYDFKLENGETIMRSLAEANDEGVSFKKIADIIEEYF